MSLFKMRQPAHPLVDAAQDALPSGNICEILGDGAYDRNEIFNKLEDRGITSTIKVRSNASRQSHGSPYRAECVRERQDSGYEQLSNRPSAVKIL